MNDSRRATLHSANALIEQARSMVDGVYDKECDALNNVPESFECTEKYEKMENAVDLLEEALSGIDDVIEQITEACQ